MVTKTFTLKFTKGAGGAHVSCPISSVSKWSYKSYLYLILLFMMLLFWHRSRSHGLIPTPDSYGPQLHGLSSWRRCRCRCRCVFSSCIISTSKAGRQRAAESLSEHGAGEDVDDGVQSRVQEVQPQGDDGELSECVEGGAVPRPVGTHHPNTNGGHSGGQEADQEHDYNGGAHPHGLTNLFRFPHLPLLQEARYPDGAEGQHGEGDHKLQHRQNAVHSHQDDDGPRRLLVGRKEETLGSVPAAFDVAVGQHGNTRTDDQQPHKNRHQRRLTLGHGVETVVRVDHLEPEIEMEVQELDTIK